MGETLAEVKKETVEKLRIKTINNQEPFINLVQQILEKKSQDSQVDTSVLEAEVD